MVLLRGGLNKFGTNAGMRLREDVHEGSIKSKPVSNEAHSGPESGVDPRLGTTRVRTT